MSIHGCNRPGPPKREIAYAGDNAAVTRYDAIVVGAGPAGSTCAQRLASAGASVLVLDRARFPRDKPCGGGVTGRAARLLPFDVDPVVEDVVTSVRMRLRFGGWFERGDGEPLVFMTQRIRLDAYLLEQAAKAGAEVRDGVKVEHAQAGPEGVEVTAGGERLHAATLVGADGVNGICGRALGLGGNQAVGVAIEGNIGYDRLRTNDYRGCAVLELGVVPGGYGWVSRRETTSTSALAAGKGRDRGSATTCATFATRTASPTTTWRACAATGSRCGLRPRRSRAGGPR